MKTQLLFTAVLMAATGVVSHNVYARQGFASVTSVSAMVAAEGENVEAEPASDDFTDYTSYVKNASCTVDDRTTWTRNNLQGNDNYLIMADVLNSDVFSGTGIEFWRKANADGALKNQDLIWQIVRGLPAGTYNVTAYAAGRDQGAGDIHNGDLFLFAADKQVQVTSNKWAEYTIEGVEVGTDGMLKIGLHGGAGNWNNWVQIADVRLVYVNNKASLDLAIEKATGINSVYNDADLSAEITTAQSIGEGETSTVYKTAIGNLNQAMDDALVANVTSDKPYQLYTIANDFSGVVPNGWTAVNGSFGRLALTNNNKATEYYHRAFEVKQELKNLRNGKYKVSVQAISNDTQDFYIYAQGDGDVTQIDKHVTANSIQEGSGNVFQQTVNYMIAHPTEQLVEIETNVINGTLTVGMRAGGNNWMVVNDFKLEILEFISLEKIKNLYLEKVEVCKQLAKSLEGKISTACLTELNKDAVEYNTIEKYTQAIDNANNMMLLANSMEAPYQEYVELRTKIQEEIAKSTGDQETLNSAIDKQNGALETAMTVEGINVARKGLLEAYQAYLKTAVPTEGQSLDLTFRLQNPTCTEGSGWDKFEGNASVGYNVNSDGKIGIETWVPAGTARKNMNLIWQTVDGLQPGKYTFKAYAVGRDQTRSGEPYNGSLYLFANDNVTEVNGRTWTERTVECIVLDDGKLTVGIAAGPDNENEWNAITDATLMYEGSVGKTDTEWMADVLAAKNAEAKTYETKHPGINPKYLDLLSNETVLGENATVEDYRAAIKSRNEEMATAYSMIPAYDSFQKTKACADELQKVASDATEVVKSAFSSSIEELGEAADNAMDVNAVRQAEEILLQAVKDYVRNASPVEGSQFDITHFYLVNADLTGLATWTAQDGWYTDTNKKIQCMQNSEVISADGKNYFYEIYGGSRTPLPTGWNLYQKVNLPAGNYEMTAYVFGKGVNDNYSGELNGTLCAGDVKGDAMTAANLTEGHVTFSLLDNVADMKLGLCVEEGTTANWAGIGYMKLYKKENVAQSLDEESETYDVQGDVYSNVTMSRILNGDEKWNTFCVPFPMTSEQLSANGIKEVRVLDEATVGTDHATLKFTQVAAVESGKPYIVKVSVPVSEIKVSGVALQSSMNDIYSNGVTMKGNYAKGVVPDGAFFINNNAFYLADTENSVQKVTLKGFRAYIESPVTGELNRMQIDIDGVVTSVEDVLGGEVPDGYRTVDVYSLSGVKVKSGVKQCEALDGLKKGIYVVEGKKVIK